MKNQKHHMILILTSTLLFLTLIGQQALAKTLTIALDLSGSNPLLLNENFNRRAANFAVQHIDGLEEGDIVELKFIGSLKDAHNFQTFKRTIERHNRRKIKRDIGRAITTLPHAVQAQDSTNLVAFWGRNTFDCSADSQTIVFTDAIESSEYVSANALLSGKATLPKPNEFVRIKDCNITFFGLGVGRSDVEALTLRRQWHAFFEAAGASFTAVML